MNSTNQTQQKKSNFICHGFDGVFTLGKVVTEELNSMFVVVGVLM